MFSENNTANKNLVAILWAILILLFILVVGLCWYFFDVKSNQKFAKEKVEQTATSVNLEKSKDFLDLSDNNPEVGGIVEKVSHLMLLPAKEFTVATVNDASNLLKENPVLFQYAKNGQKFLLYDTGIIIYDPAIDKVVDVVQFYNVRQQKLSNLIQKGE